MQKCFVDYEAGPSRKDNRAVDYMLVLCEVNGEIVELYAEMENPTWNEIEQAYEDETATFEALQAEILRQAGQHGIPEHWLQFPEFTACAHPML